MSIIVLLALSSTLITGFVVVDRDLPKMVDEASGRAIQPHARRTLALQAPSFLIALFSVVLVSQQGSLGQGILLAGTAGALVFLLFIAGIELSSRRPQTQNRKASLETRRTRDYLPMLLTKALAIEAVLFGVFSAVASAMGSADELGRPGRSLAAICANGTESSSGPWPGTFYTIPAVLAVVFGAVVAVAAIRSVMARARIEGAAKPADDFTRRHTVYTIVTAYGAMLSFSLLGMSAFASMALHGKNDCYTGVAQVAFLIPLGLFLFALFMFSWSCVGFGKNALQLCRIVLRG